MKRIELTVDKNNGFAGDNFYFNTINEAVLALENEDITPIDAEGLDSASVYWTYDGCDDMLCDFKDIKSYSSILKDVINKELKRKCKELIK